MASFESHFYLELHPRRVEVTLAAASICAHTQIYTYIDA